MRDTEVLVIGAGLSGLVAAAEAADAGRRVFLLDQEPAASIGGQAYWSFGGLFLVNSPSSAGWGSRTRPSWPWPTGSEPLISIDPKIIGRGNGPRPTWTSRPTRSDPGSRNRAFRCSRSSSRAERGGYQAGGHGNSVPRFHIAWGTGPGILTPFVRRVIDHVRTGKIVLLFRHRVTQLTTFGRRVTGVAGEILAPSAVARGEQSSREVVGDFVLSAGSVIVTSGGIGGNHDLVRRNWPAGFGEAPANMISGVPASTDGLMLGVAQAAGGRLINEDRMWHYPEGIINHSPIWPLHGIRVLSGPSPLWLDATGKRLPTPLFPGFDALGTVRHITSTGHPYSWFLTSMRTVGPEFGLSGSEQNSDLTGRSVRKLLTERAGGKITPAVQAFLDRGVDFLTADTLPELVAKMNGLAGSDLIDADDVGRTVALRDGQVRSGLGKDPQVVATAGARQYFGDRRMRTVEPHEILDPAAGPLVAVRLHILTRKTLGGLETDLSSAVLGADGAGPIPGLYAAGEAAGFGGGGVHGYRALEGTFLGGCLFSGRTAGRAAAILA